MSEFFKRRRRELLALEGWYDAGEYTFKLSCRFKDILRCSEFNGKTKHFTSCFRQEGLHYDQPIFRCMDSNWAIIYTPDKHGNFLGRCFVHYEENETWSGEVREGSAHLVVDKIYGNRLKFEDIDMTINGLSCRSSGSDTYLVRAAS